ncbi:MAG: hypothetical protein HSCHL_2262 [Hydrogenibacillus schlegelii]|uniref:Uncharacterized protein n=1 Tax=Hydrogenibacillus schlegelii TaxID=1484 RepID=A0A2T5GER2_HYDSH|nr:MAG: hypothetical protein HSCHL_2262 [Hydrogenibacillus schlegelii]
MFPSNSAGGLPLGAIPLSSLSFARLHPLLQSFLIHFPLLLPRFLPFFHDPGF